MIPTNHQWATIPRRPIVAALLFAIVALSALATVDAQVLPDRTPLSEVSKTLDGKPDPIADDVRRTWPPDAAARERAANSLSASRKGETPELGAPSVDERSETNQTPELGSWATTSGGDVWLEPNVDAYYPDRDLVFSKRTGRWSQPVRRTVRRIVAPWIPWNTPVPTYPNRYPNHYPANVTPSNCPTCPNYAPNYPSPYVGPNAPNSPFPPNYYPQNVPNFRPIPPTYPYDLGPYSQGCRDCGLSESSGESLGDSFRPLRNPLDELVR